MSRPVIRADAYGMPDAVLYRAAEPKDPVLQAGKKTLGGALVAKSLHKAPRRPTTICRWR